MILESDFLRHWKTEYLQALLDDDAQAPLYVLRIWLHLYDRKTDQLKAVPQVVVSVAQYKGPKAPDKFLQALVECGYFRMEGKQLVAHEFRAKHAKAFSNWANGPMGGRPRSSGTAAPAASGPSPAQTQRKPKANPTKTHRYPVGGVGGVGVDNTHMANSTEGEARQAAAVPPEAPDAPGACPHKDLQAYWNSLCPSSGLRSSRVWPEELARPRWADQWFRENWQGIMQECHRNRWCMENKIGPEHLLRRENARRYYEQWAERKDKKAGVQAPGRVTMCVRMSDGTVHVEDFANAAEAAKQLSAKGLKRDSVDHTLWHEAQ